MSRVTCRCGEVINVKSAAGQERIDCPKCGSRIRLRRRPSASASALIGGDSESDDGYHPVPLPVRPPAEGPGARAGSRRGSAPTAGGWSRCPSRRRPSPGVWAARGSIPTRGPRTSTPPTWPCWRSGARGTPAGRPASRAAATPRRRPCPTSGSVRRRRRTPAGPRRRWRRSRPACASAPAAASRCTSAPPPAANAARPSRADERDGRTRDGPASTRPGGNAMSTVEKRSRRARRRPSRPWPTASGSTRPSSSAAMKRCRPGLRAELDRRDRPHAQPHEPPTHGRVERPTSASGSASTRRRTPGIAGLDGATHPDGRLRRAPARRPVAHRAGTGRPATSMTENYLTGPPELVVEVARSSRPVRPRRQARRLRAPPASRSTSSWPSTPTRSTGTSAAATSWSASFPMRTGLYRSERLPGPLARPGGAPERRPRGDHRRARPRPGHARARRVRRPLADDGGARTRNGA